MTRPLIAAPTYRVYRDYCRGHGINPHAAHWLHETHQLAGLHRQTVTVVTGPSPFPSGFISYLRVLEETGLEVIRAG